MIEALDLGITVEEMSELLKRKAKGVKERIRILEKAGLLDRAP